MKGPLGLIDADDARFFGAFGSERGCLSRHRRPMFEFGISKTPEGPTPNEACIAMANAKRAPITPLRPKPDKIIAAVAYLIRSAGELGLKITQYDIVKSLFLADKSHLNRYGRPVTFDNYTAMENGPVPSTSYNFLKRDNYCMKHFGIKDFPWKSDLAPQISKQAEVYTLKDQEISFDALSESDIEELNKALQRVKELGFGKVRALTHEDPAYLEAWDEKSTQRSFSMSLSLLFDKPNEEEARNVEFLSKHS
jgi:uncharacterized phage-associated protein